MKRSDISQNTVLLAALEFKHRGADMLDAIVAATGAPLKVAQAALDREDQRGTNCVEMGITDAGIQILADAGVDTEGRRLVELSFQRSDPDFS